MAVPDFQTLTPPVLKEFADELEHPTKDIRQRVAIRLGLTAEDVVEKVPSGTQTRLANRVAWAHVYMKRARLLTIEFGVGVSDVETIKIKRLDDDYFGEE
jgi:restriction system protein